MKKKILRFCKSRLYSIKNGQAGNTSSNASCSTILQHHQRCL